MGFHWTAILKTLNRTPIPPNKQSAQITTTNINFNKSHYTAKNQTVIYGAKGTHVYSGHTTGTIVTDSSDGKEVTEDSSHHHNVVVPHMTQETQKQFEENAKWVGSEVSAAGKKVSYFFTPLDEKKDESRFYCHGMGGDSLEDEKGLVKNDKWSKFAEGNDFSEEVLELYPSFIEGFTTPYRCLAEFDFPRSTDGMSGLEKVAFYGGEVLGAGSDLTRIKESMNVSANS